MEIVKEVEAKESRLDNLANGFKATKKCLKEWKKLLLQSPSLLSEEVVVKREEIETKPKVFSEVDVIEFEDLMRR